MKLAPLGYSYERADPPRIAIAGQEYETRLSPWPARADGGKIANGMLALIRSIGLLFASIKGWLFVVGLMPAGLTYWLGIYEALSWTAIVTYTTAALATGVWLAWGVLKSYESWISHFTSSKTRARINKPIAEYIEAGETMIDIPTAAGLWAGTLATDDVQRHLFFRMIKLAVDNGSIENAEFAHGTEKATIHTRIPLNEFVDYLRTKGVLK